MTNPTNNADAGTLGFLAGFITARGKIADGGVPSRPWVSFETLDRDLTEEVRETFMYTGTIRSIEKHGRTLWRYTAHGNDALFTLQDLLPYLRGPKRDHARRLLDRWGKDGEPYPSEAERLEDQGRSYDHKPGHPRIDVGGWRERGVCNVTPR